MRGKAFNRVSSLSSFLVQLWKSWNLRWWNWWPSSFLRCHYRCIIPIQGWKWSIQLSTQGRRPNSEYQRKQRGLRYHHDARKTFPRLPNCLEGGRHHQVSQSNLPRKRWPSLFLDESFIQCILGYLLDWWYYCSRSWRSRKRFLLFRLLPQRSHLSLRRARL